MRLSACIYQFFDHYLPHIKGVSTCTIKAYRDTFKLLLPYAAKHRGIQIRSLRLKHLSSELILAFLDDLEREPKNGAKTRNHRLAAIKSFAKMVTFIYPEKRKLAENILHIPQKRTQKSLIGFLYEEEILNAFQSVELKKREVFVTIRCFICSLIQALEPVRSQASTSTTSTSSKKHWPSWEKAIGCGS